MTERDGPSLWGTPCVRVLSLSDEVETVSLSELFDRIGEFKDIVAFDPVIRAQSAVILASIVARSVVLRFPSKTPSDRMHELKNASWEDVRTWVEGYADEKRLVFSLDTFMLSNNLTYRGDVRGMSKMSVAWGRKGGSPDPQLPLGEAVWNAATMHWVAYGRVLNHNGSTKGKSGKGVYGVSGPGLSPHVLVEGPSLLQTVLWNVTASHLTDEDVPGWEVLVGDRATPAPSGPVGFNTRPHRRMAIFPDTDGMVREIQVGCGDEYDKDTAFDVRRAAWILADGRVSSPCIDATEATRAFAQVVRGLCTSPSPHVSEALRDWGLKMAPISVSAPVCGPNLTTMRGSMSFTLPVDDRLVDSDSLTAAAARSACSVYGSAVSAAQVYANIVHSAGTSSFYLRADAALRDVFCALVDEEDPDQQELILRDYGVRIVDELKDYASECDATAPLHSFLPSGSTPAVKARSKLASAIRSILSDTDPESESQ